MLQVVKFLLVQAWFVLFAFYLLKKNKLRSLLSCVFPPLQCLFSVRTCRSYLCLFLMTPPIIWNMQYWKGFFLLRSLCLPFWWWELQWSCTGVVMLGTTGEHFEQWTWAGEELSHQEGVGMGSPHFFVVIVAGARCRSAWVKVIRSPKYCSLKET